MEKKTINIPALVFKGILLVILLCSLVPQPSTERAVQQKGDADNIVYAADAGNANSNSSCVEETKGATMDKDTSKLFSQIANGIIILEKVIFAINIPLIWLIGKLISNDWVYLDGQIYTVLQTLWLFMRNVVNVIFVVVLIIMAFMTVVSGGSEKSHFAVKSMLPRLIIALVVVNFSLLACRVILDGANILTTWAFSLPNTIGTELFKNTDSQKPDQNLWCYKYKSESESETEKVKCAWDKMIIAFGDDAQEQCSNINTNQDHFFGASFAIGWSKDAKEIDINLFDSRNAMFAYAYSTLHLGSIMDVFNKGTSGEQSAEGTSPNSTTGTGNLGAKEIQGITVSIILGIIFAGILLLLNVAMFVSFAIRTVLIWISLIFSPLLALEIVFQDTTKKMIPKALGMKEGSFIKGFVSLALMPAIAGFILSLGYIMYKVIASFQITTDPHITLWPITIEVHGSPLPTFATIQQMILALLMMIFVWAAVMATLRSNAIVEKGAEQIDKFGKGIAKIAGKGITLIPWIPTGKGRTSIAAIQRVGQILPGAVTEMAGEQATKLGAAIPVLGDLMKKAGYIRVDPQSIQKITDAAKLGRTKESATQVLEVMNKEGYKNNTLKNNYVDWMEKAGFDKKFIAKFKENQETITLDELREQFRKIPGMGGYDGSISEHGSGKQEDKKTSDTKVTITNNHITVGSNAIPSIRKNDIVDYQGTDTKKSDEAKTRIEKALKEENITDSATINTILEQLKSIESKDVTDQST